MLSFTNALTTSFDFVPDTTNHSNIVRAGDSVNILASVENANWYLWPDTNKPFINQINHFNDANVSVTDNVTFHFKDTNVTSGDETGVLPNSLKVWIDSGSGYVNHTAWATYTCTGIWGTNDCTFTINPTDIGNRNWDYNKIYNIRLDSGQDKASVSQTPAGPNTMDTVSFGFTTEADTTGPTVTNNTPTTNASVNTTLSYRIQDLKSGGIYGTGVNSSTIRTDVQSAQTGLNTYQCGDLHTQCTPVTTNGLTWAYNVVITPLSVFGQNEQVFATVRDAKDYATTPNTMTNFLWNFYTSDTTAPTITGLSPASGASNLTASQHISFHVVDGGQGVNINSLVVSIGGTIFTKTGTHTFTYSGDASDYTIELTPTASFSTNVPVAITINVSDLAANALTPEFTYAVMNGENNCSTQTCPVQPICPDLKVCPVIEQCPSDQICP
jgi:hypothetical protein